MDKYINKTEKIIKNIIYFSLVFILLYMLGLAMDLNLSFFKQIAFVIIIGGIVKFFIFNPIFLFLIVIAALIIGIIVNHYFPFIENLIEVIYEFLQNIINYIIGKEYLTPKNTLWFWGILIALVSLYTGYIIFKKKKIYFLLPVYIGVFLYYWYVFFDIAYLLIGLFFFLYFILLGLDKYSKGKLKSNEINMPWLKIIITYSFLIVIIAFIVPKTHKAIRWSWLQDTAYGIFPGMEDMRSSDSDFRGEGEAESFDFSKTGYQRQTSRLGGPVRISDKKVMTVYGEGPFYLRGNIRHTYTGNVWKSLDNPMETYLNGQDFDKIPNSHKKYYEYKDITIINHFFSSTTLFSPYSPNTVYLDGNYEIQLGPDFELNFPPGIYAGENYTISILEPLPYEKLIALGINESKKDIKNLNKYLQIPKFKITKETKDLVNEIVKDSNTDYEKAVAIENYLRKNFKYNTDVEVPPKNREFIDYFLFESKEGYCTYYATTMAIMLRLQGIPSRYVEGYVARDLIDENTYIVKQKNAHAWVEAFIEPVGWMTFEPTPAYSTVPRTIERPVVSEESYEEDMELINIDNIDELREMDRTIAEAELNSEAINRDTIDVEIEASEEENILLKNILKILLGGILIGILLKFLIEFIRKEILKRKIEKLPNKERLIYEYNEILKLTRALGYPMKSGETHYEYAYRIAYRFSVFGDVGIQEITDIFVKNKYSKMETRDEDVEEMVEFKKLLKKRLKKKPSI